METLPSELLNIILSFLPPIFSLRQVCRKWRILLDQNTLYLLVKQSHDQSIRTSIKFACMSRNKRLIDYCLDNICNDFYWYAYYLAKTGKLELLQFYLAKPFVVYTNNKNYTKYDLAMIGAGNTRCYDLLDFCRQQCSSIAVLKAMSKAVKNHHNDVILYLLTIYSDNLYKLFKTALKHNNSFVQTLFCFTPDFISALKGGTIMPLPTIWTNDMTYKLAKVKYVDCLIDWLALPVDFKSLFKGAVNYGNLPLLKLLQPYMSYHVDGICKSGNKEMCCHMLGRIRLNSDRETHYIVQYGHPHLLALTLSNLSYHRLKHYRDLALDKGYILLYKKIQQERVKRKQVKKFLCRNKDIHDIIHAITLGAIVAINIWLLFS